jgi:O-antigen ligase
VVGIGFGDPLIDFLSDTGQPIRQPHNSSLNVFGRLGFLGLFIWLLLLSFVLRRLWNAAHRARTIAGVWCPLHLWLLVFAVLGLLDSLVQPYFEFSHSAVPFFFLVGFALGTDLQESAERSTTALYRANLSLRPTERNPMRTFPW